MLQKIPPGITEDHRTRLSCRGSRTVESSRIVKDRKMQEVGKFQPVVCKNKFINKKLSLGDLIGRAFICRHCKLGTTRHFSKLKKSLK